MHVADPNTPEGPIDLNPQVDGLYPGEKVKPSRSSRRTY